MTDGELYRKIHDLEANVYPKGCHWLKVPDVEKVLNEVKQDLIKNSYRIYPDKQDYSHPIEYKTSGYIVINYSAFLKWFGEPEGETEK